jgi:hypothetical protein
MVLDTTLWIFGTLRTNEQVADLLPKIDRDDDTGDQHLQTN